MSSVPTRTVREVTHGLLNYARQLVDPRTPLPEKEAIIRVLQPVAMQAILKNPMYMSRMLTYLMDLLEVEGIDVGDAPRGAGDAGVWFKWFVSVMRRQEGETYLQYVERRAAIIARIVLLPLYVSFYDISEMSLPRYPKPESEEINEELPELMGDLDKLV